MADIIVKHKKYGEGKYVNIDGQYIEVQFSTGVKKFLFPYAFDTNALETDSPWLANKIHQALQADAKQYRAPQSEIAARTKMPSPNSKDIVREIQAFSSSFYRCSFGIHRL